MIKMGCVRSIPTIRRGSEESDSYIETLTLKRRVTKKVNGQNVKISISVISDPFSSIDDMGSDGDCSYELDSGIKHKKRRGPRTLSFAEGRRFTKFPNHVGYKMCLECREHKQDVRKTMVDIGDKDLCRECSVKNRRTPRKHAEVSVHTGLDIAAFAHLLALVSFMVFCEVLSNSGKSLWSPVETQWYMF